MSDIASKLSRLSPAQRALLQKRRRTVAPARDPQAPAPLSFAQQRLWFVQQLAPDSTAYNMTITLRLRGPLDASAMQKAFDGLVARHAALRSCYRPDADGNPQQMAGTAPRLALIDCADATAELAKIVEPPFDLRQVPLRAALLREAPEDAILAIGLHHIVADRWSMGLMIRELAVLFDAACRDEAGPLPLPDLQMPDYAARQRGTQVAGLDAQIEWWRNTLRGAQALELPRKSSGNAAGGATHEFAVPDDLGFALRQEARQRGVSLFTLLLAGFNLLMYRYCDTDDITVGSDISNRDSKETQGMIGPLVNTLALRCDLSGHPDFDTALTRTQQVLRDAFAHQDVPLDQVVESLNPDRTSDEMIPLFRAKFDLQQAERLPDRIHGVRLERLPRQDRTTKYELRMNLEDDGATLSGRVEYRADLYAPEVISGMGKHFINLLRAALDDPKCPASRLAMLDVDEARKMVSLATGPALPQHAETLHQAFLDQVDRTPDAIAITDGQQEITYRDLDVQSGAIAAALGQRDMPAESRIGILMARRPDLVATILGVLRAGCAYVPLDPAYPAARLAYMAQDAGVGLILTDGGVGTVGDTLAVNIHDLPPARAPMPRGKGADLAVIIYTSGSTGQPKGVALEHRNILSRIAWAGTVFEPQDLSGVLFATSVSFDLSLFEIFATLANGGRMVMAQSLLDLPTDAGVTLLNTVPSLLRELVKNNDLPASVRCINLAGEFFPPALLERLLEFPQLKTINNLYGPTEDAIYDAGNPVQDEPERPMPIGRPFPGSRIYVLDRNGALMPTGLTGELCVAGAGLARGYLNRPELTTERFLPDPFQDGETARLYRSGDRGRWRADGRIDILGRIDTQVKLRGQRIEAGEIENRLETHPNVAEAAVLITGEPADIDRQLIGHIAPVPGQSIAPETLRDFLAAQLPAHMVPTLWQVHDTLPRMPNGKVDRPALNAFAGGEHRPHVAPETETERRVIAIWHAFLDQPEIGAEDDFFALGGHSLLAMRLLARLQQDFTVHLTLGQMFNALTPRKQAALLDATIGQSPDAPQASDPTAGLSDAEVDALLAQMAPNTTKEQA
ncbi:amino acid adenylation domain-containing protein [Pseudorhodobacter turbinis]|uniref:Amino acid adenylation domain-containing protein n=1 Tax=Pseudorhodobacter turbinis TaxID=2500533 RepID=A0A4P8EG26_9RHOB|nr:non-ribosomal peptide synthetase [Pseudorhodobacter turbinis]QCO55739.1 amino acid adenylation domain-containing protein [Pseudorhodobacter turbinis]